MMTDPLPIQPFTCEAKGQVQIPGSKSITNRAMVLAALGHGESLLSRCLFSEDTEIMGDALRQLGIPVDSNESQKTIRIQGTGRNWPVADAEIFVGNAGTAARFLSAMLCLHPSGNYRLDGTKAMRKRPMQGLIDALRKIGAKITCHEQEGLFPFTLETHGLNGGVWDVDAKQSSQILSALLMVAPMAGGDVEVALDGGTVSQPFITMTVEMMRGFGVNIKGDGLSGTKILHGQSYQPTRHSWKVEPDATAASYFMSLPLVVGGKIILPGLHLDMLQGDIGFEAVLRKAGAIPSFTGEGMESTGPTGQILGGKHDFNAISDTFLTLAAIAPLFEGPTFIRGIGHTRRQETDRIHAMATELRRLGQHVNETSDSIEIVPDRKALQAKASEGVTLETYEDHRVAMSFGILGCRDLRNNGSAWLRLNNPGCCAKTFPDFFEILENLRQSSMEA